MADTKTASAQPTAKASKEQKTATIKKIIKDVCAEYFPDTIARVPGVEDIFCRLLQTESSLNEYLVDDYNRWGENFLMKHITASPTARNVLLVLGVGPGQYSSVPNNNLRAKEAIIPFGLGQVMGWHMIQGLEIPAGGLFIKDFTRVKRKDGNNLFVNLNFTAGQLTSMFQGNDRIDNQVRAALVVINDKYKRYLTPWTRNKVRYNPLPPDQAFKEAVGDYLGRGKKGDAGGTTAETYIARIYGTNDLSVSLATGPKSTPTKAGPKTDSTKVAATKPGCDKNTS